MSAAVVHGFFKEGGLHFAKLGMCATVFCAVQVLAAQLNCLLYRLTIVIPYRRIHEASPSFFLFQHTTHFATSWYV
uniref:Secreted protein n=1 Tax=Ditylenchus dipsaci TaxID=166011 RepID=A0A915CZK3_9BILA